MTKNAKTLFFVFLFGLVVVLIATQFAKNQLATTKISQSTPGAGIQNSGGPIESATVTTSESQSGGGGGHGGGGKAVQRLDSSSYTNTLENVKRLMDAQDFQAALASLD